MSSSQQACPMTGTCRAGQRLICLPLRPSVLASQSASARPAISVRCFALNRRNVWKQG